MVAEEILARENPFSKIENFTAAESGGLECVARIVRTCAEENTKRRFSSSSRKFLIGLVRVYASR